MRAFFGSTVGKKAVMAVTGLIWVAYLVLHMSGNLLAFAGRDRINAYSAFLQGPGAELLWLARAILVAALVLHVVVAVQLTRLARQARPVGYHAREPQVSTWSSRTMRVGGLLILAFIVFHVLHFTTRQVDPAGFAAATDAAGRHDVYGNLVASFRIWWVSAIYLLAMAAVGLHLWHGTWSFGRSLGIARPSDQPLRRRVAAVVTLVIWLGFSMIPIAIMAGVIR